MGAALTLVLGRVTESNDKCYESESHWDTNVIRMQFKSNLCK